jgi:hypothetical protein
MKQNIKQATFYFAAISLPQPWPCYFAQFEKCKFDGEGVEFTTTASGKGGNARTPVLHHINGDHEDDRIENWAWCHSSCHARHHKVGTHLSEQAKEKVRRFQTGQKRSDETRAKLRAVHRKPISIETRMKMSKAAKRREEQKRKQK